MVMVILTIYGIFMVIMMRQLNVFWQFQFVRIIWNVYLKSRMYLRQCRGFFGARIGVDSPFFMVSKTSGCFLLRRLYLKNIDRKFAKV